MQHLQQFNLAEKVYPKVWRPTLIIAKHNRIIAESFSI